jgi:hypothetical protein
MLHRFPNNEYIPYNELISLYPWETIGYSSEERPIVYASIGSGERDICIWAGMHGNETTGIHIILELLHEFQLKQWLNSEFKLHCIPVINPDAYVRYTRRNGMGLDLNRDFRAFQTIESAKLIGWIRSINPVLCFNLHDQRTIFHVQGISAFTSLLVPSAEKSQKITPLRRALMNRLGNALKQSENDLVGVGRYTDKYYPTAVGDYLMSSNIPNILIESGVSSGDMSRIKAREFGVEIIQKTLLATDEHCEVYDQLPLNEKGQLEWVITDVLYANMRIDVGLKRVEAMNGHVKASIYMVDDLGDLAARPRLYEIDGKDIVLGEVLMVDRPITADFGSVTFEDGKVIAGQLKE